MGNPLTQALAAGDREAFAALYDRLAHRLFATARTMLASSAEAEDVVHDLFVELARIRHRLPGITDLDGYVFTMLRNAVGRRLKRQSLSRRTLDRLGRERADAGGFEAQPPEPPDEALARALTALPTSQREVIALKIDGGLTFAEIAAVIGTSANTAASRYRYALEKLRTALATDEVPR
ncbi:MAG: sigma-70 family RNA polymerase sigma factor [Planctomycetia bacterium]